MLVHGIIFGGPIGVAPYIVASITLPIISIFAASRLRSKKLSKPETRRSSVHHSAAA